MNKKNYRLQIFVIIMLAISTLIAGEAAYFLLKPKPAQNLLITATIVRDGSVISKPQIVVVSGVHATVSQSSDEDSMTFKVLAHVMKGSEVLVDLDFCRGEAISVYNEPESQVWCQEQTEQKLIVKLGETKTLSPLDSKTQIEVRVDNHVPVDLSAYNELDRILSGSDTYTASL